ncbi:MAG: OPT family oligopeptide transporter [Myxococcota bacterium]|nr:OPT family oligopeptide transporter [Myxococcota bacterium]
MQFTDGILTAFSTVFDDAMSSTCHCPNATSALQSGWQQRGRGRIMVDDGVTKELNSVSGDKAKVTAGTHADQMYFPTPDEQQLTLRALVAGCIVGGVVACTNIYIGLKIGWTFGASIVSAVLGFALFSALGQRLSVLETNITQTAGSGAGSMASAAGLVAAIPAMQLLGYEIGGTSLMLWSLSIAFLGVFFAVPLRRQMVEIDKLRFPTGTATAETVLAMFVEAKEAAAKAKVLIWAGVFAGIFTLTAHFIPEIENPPLHEWFPNVVLVTAATWTFKIYLGPSLIGAGFLIGPRVVLSLLLGALVAWGVLGPIAQSQGWAPGAVTSYGDGARGWLLWPGVALMVSEALITLILSWKTFVRAFRMPASLGDGVENPNAIPNSWWMSGLAAGTVLTMVIGYYVFDMAPWLTLLAVALSSILAIVAVRSTGETDINPVGGMGKVTQLVYGGIAPGQAGTNLMAAAITGAGASQAADMMQDLKTGYLLGASPRKQFLAQLVGICAGVLFVVPVYYLFTAGYELGGEKLPAPAAMAWKAMAELLTQGLDALPMMAGPAALAGSIVGVLLVLLRRIETFKSYVPSGLAMGIAFIIPAYYSLVMFYGLAIWWVWRRRSPQSVDRFNFALASGLIAGEGLMGIVNAALTVLGIG